MSGPSISAYLLEVLLLSIFPGPTVCAVVAFASQQKVSQALAMITGVLAANAVAIAASGALRATGFLLPSFLYQPLASIGAAMLMLIGLRMVLQCLEIQCNSKHPRAMSLPGAFCCGFLVHASNPRTFTFFTSIFLSTVPLNSDYMKNVVTLGMCAVAIDFMILSAYTALAPHLGLSRLRDGLLAKTPIIAGVVLIIWGATLLIFHVGKVLDAT
jgi:threonine/homoserine/homoserine lactone efflux protein